MTLGYGWQLISLSSVQNGAAVLKLRKVGLKVEEADVHICVYDGQPSGIAQTTLFDLLLMDGRNGNDPTPEQLGRVVLGIAQRIRRNELLEVDWKSVKQVQRQCQKQKMQKE